MPVVLEVEFLKQLLEVRGFSGIVGTCLVLKPDVQAELHPSHHVDGSEGVFRQLLFKLCGLGFPSRSEAVKLVREAVDGPKEGVEQDPVVVHGDAHLKAGARQMDLVRRLQSDKLGETGCRAI
jgi:hypothetical protein